MNVGPARDRDPSYSLRASTGRPRSTRSGDGESLFAAGTSCSTGDAPRHGSRRRGRALSVRAPAVAYSVDARGPLGRHGRPRLRARASATRRARRPDCSARSSPCSAAIVLGPRRSASSSRSTERRTRAGCSPRRPELCVFVFDAAPRDVGPPPTSTADHADSSTSSRASSTFGVDGRRPPRRPGRGSPRRPASRDTVPQRAATPCALPQRSTRRARVRRLLRAGSAARRGRSRVRESSTSRGAAALNALRRDVRGSATTSCAPEVTVAQIARASCASGGSSSGARATRARRAASC